ncbi:hypothetical protein CVT26_011361 [Gymnopilus dilepis]|uniref:Uncharacterized protein n=1 Tax=Gymnopilus dilepis TaxID=231916 RepID=A0A409YH98_9AGAR|nr:hypothetical protein CVT26_011361 [Gymnopilus dilepis]
MRISFNLAVIIGLVAGFVFGGLLAASWYLFKRRSRRRKQACPEDNYTAFHKAGSKSRRRKLRFVDEFDSSEPVAARQSPVSRPHILPPKSQLETSLSRGRSLRSTDTISIYSTDSAPLELHDRLVQTDCRSGQTRGKFNDSQWQGYSTLDPFYTDRLPRTRVSSGRHKQSSSFLPLYNDPSLYEQPTIKHVVPLLYGRGLKS